MTINITPGWNITPGTIVKDYNISDLFQFTTPTIISTANTMQALSLAVNSNDTFVAVGPVGTVGSNTNWTNGGYITSTDGVNWTAPKLFNSANIYNMYSVASSPNSNLFVAVGNRSSPDTSNLIPIIASSNNGGITWTTPAPITQNYSQLFSVAINSSGRSVAVGWVFNIDGTGSVYPITTTSTDGVTWTTPAPIITNRQIYLGLIAVNPSNVFVAVGSEVYTNNGYSFTSVNGTTWSGPFSTPAVYTSIRWWGSPFNTFFAYGSGYYLTSTDGINWSAPVQFNHSSYNSIASNKNGYIVGTYIPSSTSYYSVSSNINSPDTNYRNFNSTDFSAYSVVSDSSGRFVVVGNSPDYYLNGSIYSNNFAMYSTSYNMLY